MEVAQQDRTVILGLGGSGSHILAEITGDETLDKVELGVADTDQKALEGIPRIIQIPLGRNWTRQSGCGGNAMLGEKAASASVDDLQQFIQNAALVLVVCGLGGGTGSGAARVVARLTRQLNQMSLFIVSLPFAFEGNWRCHQAEKDLEILRGLSDTVIAIPNDLLFTTLPANTPAAQAFEAANTVLAQGISGLVRMAQSHALLAVDVPALRTLLKGRPSVCTIGVGHGTGPERWQQVIEEFYRCPLIGSPEVLNRADAAVIILVAGQDLAMGEMQTCLSSLQQHFPVNAQIFVGAYADPHCRDEVHLTVLTCRFTPDVAPPAVPGTPATPGLNTGGRRKKKSKSIADTQQIPLPLQEQSLGFFSGSNPTLVNGNGENLDVPTFQRRGINLDLGD